MKSPRKALARNLCKASFEDVASANFSSTRGKPSSAKKGLEIQVQGCHALLLTCQRASRHSGSQDIHVQQGPGLKQPLRVPAHGEDEEGLELERRESRATDEGLLVGRNSWIAKIPSHNVLCRLYACNETLNMAAG